MDVDVWTSGDITSAAEAIDDVTNVAANLEPDAPITISGDFNQCLLHDVLPTFQQFCELWDPLL